ncbi:GDP-mannose--glycolipid 4-beta-D-mannosyltransferase [Microbacterium sediminicola]|uniref:GDP-mannose--glycolipid 4-beta-D-mannosyltransferase n=1 Tax=Microbacterium sediminicola TaxID=415210 RepID=A0ABN2HFJ9_9MICO
MRSTALTVLWSTGPLKPDDNPYLHQLMAGVREQVTVLPLSTKAALLTRPDVFHVHWPHQLYRAAGWPKTLIKRVLSTWLLLRLRARRVPVVLTVHNRASHEREGGFEGWMLRLLERLITTRIYLNAAADNDLTQGVVMLHPDYRDWLTAHGALGAGSPGAEVEAERDVVLFGMLRPYKGIEALLDAATAAGATLTVTGRALDPDYGRALAERFAGAATAELDERHRDDTELVAEIRRHRLVCLPYPHMYNSGALLYALSVGRPVLVPSSGANEAIAAEVGADWVMLYDGDLTGEVVADALRRVPDSGGPDLSKRDWPTHIAAHVALYRELAARRG